MASQMQERLGVRHAQQCGEIFARGRLQRRERRDTPLEARSARGPREAREPRKDLEGITRPDAQRAFAIEQIAERAAHDFGRGERENLLGRDVAGVAERGAAARLPAID
jgi:hypothetical protein